MERGWKLEKEDWLWEVDSGEERVGFRQQNSSDYWLEIEKRAEAFSKNCKSKDLIMTEVFFIAK